LGSPVEGRPPAVCAYYVETVLRPGRFSEVCRGTVPFGQYTDDSQLARELLVSLLHCDGWCPEDYARRVAALFAEGTIFGYGRATLEAAMRLLAGVPWQEAGAPPPTAGNGSAMRAGPVGLWYHAEPGELVRVAAEQGRITHQDPRCCAGAAAVAGAVALALRPGPIQPTAFLGELAAWCHPLDAEFAGHLLSLVGWLNLPPAEAVQPITAAGAEPDLIGGWQGISPFVVASVLWSLYAFLRTPDDYLATIYTAIAVGGDVDTTAAMAGAMSGARLGLSALPQEAVQQLNDRGAWGYEELLGLARDCHARRCIPPEATP